MTNHTSVDAITGGREMPDEDTTQPQPFELPEDLTAVDADGRYTVTDEQLAELHEQAQAAFDALYEDGTAPDAAGLARANELVGAIETLRAESGRREEQRAATAAELEALRHRVHGDPAADNSDQDQPDGSDDTGTSEPDTPPAPEGEPASEPTAEVVEGEVVQAEPALVAGNTAGTIPVDRQRLDAGRRRLNDHLRKSSARGGGGGYHPGMGSQVSLAQARQFAPDTKAPAQPRQESVLVAAGEIPGFPVGQKLPSVRDLAAAMSSRAKAVSVGRSAGGAATRHPVAYLERQHQFTLTEKSTPEEVDQVLRAATNTEVLVAAGGWCAPPTTSYDFYNIVCEDGILDLPTVGVPRGSMQWPVSPSFGDIMGLDDNPWTWTNQDDVDALGTNGPEKPCQRIPCPELDDATLDCDGICLTVGNLTNYAWPELVENHTRLLMAAQTHYMNMRRIQALVSASDAVTVDFFGGAGFVAPVLAALDLQAWDYREKFRMCNNGLLEAVLPRWVIGMVSADISLRQGLSPDEAFTVAVGRLADWLDARNIRAQFVSDWQIGNPGQLGGATPATSWPATVQALLYAPGTFVLGQGLRLNLGIIRDSVLNATNDFTAAWMEECTLVAQIGHESRLVTIPVCPNGVTNAGAQLACGS